MDLPEVLPTQTPSSPPPPVGSAADPDRADIDQNKDIAAFSYLWIMSVVVFFLKRKSPFVAYHAKQGIVLFLLSLIVLLVPYVSKILELCVLGLMVMGFLHAAQGQRKDIPIVGPLSRREIGIRDAWKQLVDAIVRLIGKLKSFRSPMPSPPPSHPSPSQPS